MAVQTKTNRLAIASFMSGLFALTLISVIFLLYNLQPGQSILMDLTDGILLPLRNLAVAAAIVTGILALIDIKNKAGAEKGKLLAWLGIAFGTAWVLVGLVVGLVFLLGGLG